MLKIWKGLEMEGPSIGMATMFVCSDVPVEPSILYRLLEDNQDIKRLYFGAGRKSFIGPEDWTTMRDNLVRVYGIDSITIEANASVLLGFISRYDAPFVNFVCAWYDFPVVDGNLYFKTDDTTKVKIHTSTTTTLLDTLGDDNLFSNDVLLYKED